MSKRKVVHGRIKGNKITENIVPKVELISSTANPVETIFSVWHNSRHTESILPKDILLMREVLDSTNTTNEEEEKVNEICKAILNSYPEYHDGLEFESTLARVEHVIEQVVILAIQCDVQASEFISYEFQVTNGSVAWREQIVRNRQLHVWTQTSRTADLREFDALRLPSVGEIGGEEAVEIYDNAVETLRQAYRDLSDLGVPTEDIRLIPQSYVHRTAFGGNLRTLIGLINKRSSWIAQSVLWLPIMSQMLAYLRADLGDTIVDSFAGQVADATISDGKVLDYKYDNEVLDRYHQRDPQPVDPLWLAAHGLVMPEHTDLEFYDRLKEMYLNIWGSDILEILGWDRQDPTKIGPYDRPYSWYEYDVRPSEKYLIDQYEWMKDNLKDNTNE